MTPISALAILFCIYAVSDLIAQKTKAIFSTVLSIAILLLAGFWSGILPRTLIDDAQITGFGNIIAGLLIVSLGTTIDFAELRRQWKVVVTALCGVCGAVAAIVLIGRPFIGSEMAIAGAPIFAGGSAATLIMTSTLKEMNLTTAATFCIVLYVTQKFIGVPIASLLLRRTAKLIRDDAVLVEQYSTLQEENDATHHGPLHLPKCCERPSPIKVLDFTNLAGSFGQIGDTGANLIGKGGTGAKDGFMAGFNLIPAVMFFCGLLGVFEQLGAFKASDILFRPLLRPLLGIPGKCGIAFISSFTGSDVAAVMTRELYEDGEITDDERTIFVAYQYAGSACINNTITGGAPLVAICPVALGPCIVIMFVCKLIGANIVRLILRAKRGKA